jgi:predicted dehydrogenase
MDVDPTNVPNPALTPVLLFGGGGEWSTRHWLPVLAQLARDGKIYLTVVELRPLSECPLNLQVLQRDGLLRYLTWGDFEKSAQGPWRLAIVVTSPSSHCHVIRTVLRHAPDVKIVIIEKPCGDVIEQALEIFGACDRRGVALLIADHYLLKPGVQFLIGRPDILNSIGEPVEIVAVIDESRLGGPQQDVIKDLIVHLINLMCVLYPGAHFTPNTAFTAQVLNSAVAGRETFTHAIGRLNLKDGSAVECDLEAAKGIVIDKKSMTLVGTKGRIELDFINNSLKIALKMKNSTEVNMQWQIQWSYKPLILKSLSLI